MSNLKNIKKLESKDSGDINALFSATAKSLNGDLPIHWHSFFEIDYVISGSGEYILNGEVHLIKNNVLFLSTPSDFQEMHFSSETEIITTQFSAELVERDLYPGLTGPIIAEDNGDFFLRILQSLCMHDPKSRDYNQKFVKNMLNSLLFLICSDENKILVKSKNDFTEYFHEILMYINEHFNEQLSLADLSQQFHLHPEYISRLFKKDSNQTFSEYLIDIRLSHAYNLLRLSELPVFEIAMQSGYTSFSHFTRMFKRKYGLSPTQVRKQLRNR